MRYLIEHETLLEYPYPIRDHHVELRLVPRYDEHQRVLACSVETEPAARKASYTDYFGNRVDYLCVIAPHRRLLTRLTAEVETRKENRFDFLPVDPREQRQWLKDALRLTPALHDFVLHKSPVTPGYRELAGALRREPPPSRRGGPRSIT